MNYLQRISLVHVVFSGSLLVIWFFGQERILRYVARIHKTELEKFSESALTEDIIVLEGLPNQTWEKELFESELKRDDLVEVAGFTFYKSPLDLPQDEEYVIRSMLSDIDNYEKFGGEKDCGGFHPDYALRLDGKYYMLVSFSCGGLKVISEGRVLDFELSEEGFYIFDLLLTGRYQNRPFSERFGRYLLSKP